MQGLSLGSGIWINLRLWTTVRLLSASGLGLVRVLKSVYGSQPRCHLGFTHATVYGQATTRKLSLMSVKL